MKLCLPAFVAMSFALSQLVVPVALAQAPASPFRSVEAKAFTSTDLQRYGLTDAEVATVQDYQAQGYEVQVMTPEEAEAYNAGMTTNNVLAIIGLVVIIIVVASAVS